MLEGGNSELDTDIDPNPCVVGHFPTTDAVLCVTVRGCSCALMQGLGVAGRSKSEVHFAGPGYLLRRALAAAALRFGSVRLFAYRASQAPAVGTQPRQRTTTLGQFLRSGLDPDDEVVCIQA